MEKELIEMTCRDEMVKRDKDKEEIMRQSCNGGWWWQR
jgi:hypothetical protein